ncbi:hypothetical protein HN592_04990 [Candidatus Woesearchaeota archaeon]|nr:hypothetical protein [Candidatus Woesearchaeota archaeon]MBT4367742.1 hypothetical protein [Candidatus Woesearchaeota archaeon]MBT4712230.1 hypothetical protein [Candidatus Woesearchaeota archaeon]MBT6638778.1 hypothetical protein [Candidatus Woesearchaeota archaeon]MBT7134422.1 hypothetical protein [Candidatus Woesearchaeota archaeon]
MKKCENNPFVAIPSSLGGLYLGAAVLIMIFLGAAGIQAMISIAWAFVVLGAIALYFAYKSGIKREKK